MGPSGSGKSTLLNLLGLLDRPTEGTYRLAGRDVQDLKDAERSRIRARQVGFVFQSFELMNHRSSLENVMLAGMYAGVPKERRLVRAREALNAVGLPDRENQAPQHMSGGERQRVAIARAIAGDPTILLCDEPTGNLDTANSKRVVSLLDSLNQSGMTIILITHDPEVAASGSRTFQIRDGLISEENGP
jgi:putative ABC transport system ATP-binding protein